ncbi:uncharacterized protein LOC123526589 [Mercenaria mercenaria]|uniref:uncharacterized protein LOC123526589 n=1 Tax=Mercenaria mercenaria TaxID=6596 RepID=UPI00234EBFEF|nr:uncharacterized protein LOC123526589 [Mercenaria mercenaria]
MTMWGLLLLVSVGGCLGMNQLPITANWNGGFKGEFIVTGELHNWKVHLIFDKPVDQLEVYKFSIERRLNGGREFILRALPEHANLAAGTTLACVVVARRNGDAYPHGRYSIVGKHTGSGTSSNVGTSSAGTTTGSSSGPTTRVTSTGVPSIRSTSYWRKTPPTTPSGAGSPMKYDYNEALRLSILFYDAQRSGHLPPNNPIPWREDSAVNDGADGHDLSGGWYDGGDHVKFGLPMAWSTWVLLYGMLEFRDGYEAAGQIDKACDMIRTPLEYFLKCWIPGQQTLYVQVGDGHVDHGYWGRPENMNMGRPAYKVTTSCHGSDVAGDTAAAMAAGYLVFKDMCGDTGFADKLLDASKSLYTFAKNNRGKYTDCITQAKDFYWSTGEADELSVAGAWLYKATNDQSYLNDAKEFYPIGTAWSFNWDDANTGAALLLYDITKDGKYKTDIESLVNAFQPGGDVPTTPCGLAWRDQWGPNRYAGSPMKYDYNEALRLSILFYDAQRSGRLPPNNPIPWREDSAVNDGADGHDLSGGWYDGGDHVKFGLPMAWSTWVLLYGMLEFRDGYEAAGQIDKACDMIRTPLKYFLKCWIPGEQTLYVQVGDGHVDHGYWGRPENMNMRRPAYKVTTSCHGSDVAGDTAAAMAAGYLVFKDMCGDTGFADKLLEASKSLYTFAKNNRGKYTDCITQAKDFYWSTGEADELSVAGAWLYKATNDQSYLNDAKEFYPTGTAWSFNWDDANTGAALLLYDITKDGKYKTDIEGLVNSFQPGGDVPTTPCGLAWRDQWGPNRYAANVAFIATMAARYGIQSDAYNKWAMSQINYLLGDNKLNMSYEIGFGSNFPKRPHHRGSSCSTSNVCAQGNETNPNILKGGLVGGPDQWDNYGDRREAYVKNEVACDYNAGFQSALAGLIHFAHNNNLPAAPAAKC